MTGIQKINIKEIQNIKNVLGYAVKNIKGYYKNLKKADNKLGETLNQLKTVGFINTKHTLNSEKYSITSLGDEYYKDLFGTWNYLGKRISGIFERFVKRHL